MRTEQRQPFLPQEPWDAHEDRAWAQPEVAQPWLRGEGLDQRAVPHQRRVSGSATTAPGSKKKAQRPIQKLLRDSTVLLLVFGVWAFGGVLFYWLYKPDGDTGYTLAYRLMGRAEPGSPCEVPVTDWRTKHEYKIDFDWHQRGCAELAREQDPPAVQGCCGVHASIQGGLVSPVGSGAGVDDSLAFRVYTDASFLQLSVAPLHSSGTLGQFSSVLNRTQLPNGTSGEQAADPPWMIVDTSGFVWLAEIGAPKHLGFHLEYKSNDQATGAHPLLALSWAGSGFDSGVLSSDWFFYPRSLSLAEHLAKHDLSTRVWTVIVIVSLLGLMWIYGESVFILNGARDKIAEQKEFEQIKQYRAEQFQARAGNLQAVVPLDDDGNTVLPYSLKWGAKLHKWRKRKQLVQKSHQGISLKAVASYVLFFLIGMGVVALFLVLAPQPPDPVKEASDLADPWFYLNPFRDIAQYGWYDFFCFGALVLETFLFLWALLKVNWPAKGVKERAIEADLEAAMLLQEDSRDQVALLIAAHKCDSTKEKRQGLEAALRAALRRFPASSIFVCDNAETEAPPDATYELVQEVCRQEGVTEQINYVYLPVGNKTVAFFWVIDVWMPVLQKHQVCPHFKYILTIDDDVQVPEELRLPLRAFGKESDVQAYAYCINCFHNTALEGPEAPMLVRFQNIEYTVAGFFKQFQAAYGTALAAHGAISLWRRDILTSKIFWEHDTVFNGEDLQMGLILHSMKAGYAINVSSREIVMTEPPADFYTLWKQRVKSWDVTQHRKTLTFLQIVLFHWCGGIKTLILKPFLLMEVFNITQDWARIFFFGYLLTYNEGRVHLAQWLIYLVLLQWVGLYVFYKKTLKHRPEDRDHWTAYLLYPVLYKPLTQLFRWYALLESIVRTEKPASKIRDKEELQILPPKPLMRPDEIDWQTLWTADVPEGYEDMMAVSMRVSEPSEVKSGNFFV